jgi:hypothetical protein
VVAEACLSWLLEAGDLDPSGDIPERWPRWRVIRQNPFVTLREVVARIDEFADDETIYAESASPTARAAVAAEPADGSVPPTAAGLTYLLEVDVAREAIAVWCAWRPDRAPTLDDQLAAVTYYAENDAWLPIE